MIDRLKRLFQTHERAALDPATGGRVADARIVALIDRGLSNPHSISVEEIQELCECLKAYVCDRASRRELEDVC